MKIQMIETAPGSENGYTVTEYRAGAEYDVGEPLARTFIASGLARALVAPLAHPPAHPLDHDRDGAPGGSLPAAERGIDDLRAEAEAMGIKADRRWGAARLAQEIAKGAA